MENDLRKVGQSSLQYWFYHLYPCASHSYWTILHNIGLIKTDNRANILMKLFPIRLAGGPANNLNEVTTERVCYRIKMFDEWLSDSPFQNDWPSYWTQGTLMAIHKPLSNNQWLWWVSKNLFSTLTSSKSSKTFLSTFFIGTATLWPVGQTKSDVCCPIYSLTPTLIVPTNVYITVTVGECNAIVVQWRKLSYVITTFMSNLGMKKYIK